MLSAIADIKENRKHPKAITFCIFMFNLQLVKQIFPAFPSDPGRNGSLTFEIVCHNIIGGADTRPESNFTVIL